MFAKKYNQSYVILNLFLNFKIAFTNPLRLPPPESVKLLSVHLRIPTPFKFLMETSRTCHVGSRFLRWTARPTVRTSERLARSRRRRYVQRKSFNGTNPIVELVPGRTGRFVGCRWLSTRHFDRLSKSPALAAIELKQRKLMARVKRSKSIFFLCFSNSSSRISQDCFTKSLKLSKECEFMRMFDITLISFNIYLKSVS